MFDIDYLTNSMNYKPVTAENQANKSAGPQKANNSARTQANVDAGDNEEDIEPDKEHFVLPIWSAYSKIVKNSYDMITKKTCLKTCEKPVSQVEQVFLEELEKLKRQEKETNDSAEALRKEDAHESQNANTSSTNPVNTTSIPIGTTSTSRVFNVDELLYPDFEDIHASPSERIFANASYDDEGVVTDFNNLETTMNVSLTPITRIHPFILKLKFFEILSQMFKQGEK
uniref:Uncharacterized protein n=1 Tax=Tanacetum cinerariifolium TaxID=118510 RepID=A0A699JBA7_TANCI|nr:hypothetical protein [Tanacetum cinerariifolium]